MDEFICISCWKEFALEHDEVVSQQGKVVCPNCGYILQVDAANSGGATGDAGSGLKAEGSSLDATSNASDLSEVIDWGEFTGEPGSEEPTADPEDRTVETTGGFPDDLTPPEGASTENPPPLPDDEEIGFDDPDADEKTPFEPVDTPAILLESAEPELPEGPIEWRLRTSSGLTFRFTDPDALLGWKKKINIYREMHVSPDGENWVDYVFFVKRFETCGDAVKAFSQAGKTTEELDIPDVPPQSNTAINSAPDVEPGDDPDGESEPEEDPASTIPTTQFTFRTTDRQGSRGKQVLLLIVGLALGAGAAWMALTWFQIL